MSNLKIGDRVNYIGTDVHIKSGNPYKIFCESKTRAGYALIESEEFLSIHNVATKNLVRIQEPVESEPFAYVKTEEQLSSNVVHPKHYNNHPSGVECWDIIEHMPFNVGSAMKYIWRYKDKGDPIENLEKAIENIKREIERIKKFGYDTNGKLKEDFK